MAIMPFLSFACPPVAVLATLNPIPDILYCGPRANKIIQIFRLSRQIIHLAIMPFIISSCHAAIIPYHYRDALFRFCHPLVFRPLSSTPLFVVDRNSPSLRCIRFFGLQLISNHPLLHLELHISPASLIDLLLAEVYWPIRMKLEPQAFQLLSSRQSCHTCLRASLDS